MQCHTDNGLSTVQLGLLKTTNHTKYLGGGMFSQKKGLDDARILHGFCVNCVRVLLEFCVDHV
jgi:hypothetical protein